jgi:20S proteasome subunit alpha 2
MTERYSFSLTTFSPSGKLVQIEYALAAVNAGAPSVAVKARNGAVLATEKNFKSNLYDEHSVYKIEQVSENIGMVYSGMGPDYRVLVKAARKKVVAYKLQYGCEIPCNQLVMRVAEVMQEYTQSGGVRPFGVSLLIAGYDEDKKTGLPRPVIFQCDPSGAYFAWKATVLGKNHLNSRVFLEKRYPKNEGDDALELEDAIHTAILTLKESFDGQMDKNNIEIGIVNEDGFKRLTPSEVQDYLDTI